MIRTSIANSEHGEGPVLKFEIEGRGGKATANLSPQSALSLRRRIDSLLVQIVDKAIDDGNIDEVFG